MLALKKKIKIKIFFVSQKQLQRLRLEVETRRRQDSTQVPFWLDSQVKGLWRSWEKNLIATTLMEEHT